ncbi:amino acid ABC transporter substrate-binding protein [Actinomadura rudentiformis]|uniref:Amino acid ABC transporter substrate-binding protein n=2 Tax=Actinomadura rudentiformis TaxID=359158 RepID=A0A6H9YAD9_9ACTN|nr:amino acid ABC transporter substrate-binding protein [Actinomadura rudentiformis]
MVTVAAGCGGADAGAEGTENATNVYGTLKPGVLTVAIQPYMPYTGTEGKKLVGIDSEILQHVAGKLNLKLEPKVTDFNGMLGSIQAQRADITIGGIAWTKERQEQGLFTDPPYYSPPAMAVRGDGQYPTVESLRGLSMGTVTGYVWVKSIQAVPDSKLRTYPNANGVFSDLGAGRISVGFLDPLLIIYTQQKRPDLKFSTRYLTPPTDAQVKEEKAFEYLRPYMTSFYIPKQEPKLEQAISEGIRQMYADGTMTTLIKKYGGDPDQFLKASPWMGALRAGVDRPAGWKPPSL